MKIHPPIFLILFLLLLLTLPSAGLRAQSNVGVRGLGFFRNWEMNRRLAFLSGVPESEARQLGFVELSDTAYILLQLLKRQGYDHPVVTGQVQFADESRQSYSWSLPFETRDWSGENKSEIQSVIYTCEPGILSFYEKVTIQGVEVLPKKAIQSFFIPGGSVFISRKDRAFTSSNFQARITRLITALQNRGFQDARVTDKSVQRNEETGAVEIELHLEEGPLHKVGKMTIVESYPFGKSTESETIQHSGQILNGDWLQEQRQLLLNEHYKNGYPEARVFVERHPRGRENPETTIVDVIFRAELGLPKTLSELHFEPVGLLKESVLQRQVDLETGQKFNLLKVEEGRRRLLSLGIFKDISLEQENLDSERRMVTYSLVPLPEKTLNLSLGWGSYEKGRIGMIWRQLNIWNRAHQYEVRIRASFKAYGADITYSVPQFFDDRVEAYTRAGHEYREEISYDWDTTKLVFGASTRLQWPGINLSVEYSLEDINTKRRESREEFDSADNATVSSVSVRAVMDRRDSGLYPTNGYDLSVFSKTATQFLGGEADYQKLEISGSWHKFFGNALYFHSALGYGTIFSESPTEENLPFNERFFLGGENSVRGYKRGEASPLSSEGDLIGAETMAIANLELEQRLFKNFAVVLFWDGVGLSRKQATFPDEEFLQSVGLGLRWRTPVGPIRLEYGHNLDPRPEDPDGSLHLSVGFPF